jgi:hypothetical protein
VGLHDIEGLAVVPRDADLVALLVQDPLAERAVGVALQHAEAGVAGGPAAGEREERVGRAVGGDVAAADEADDDAAVDVVPRQAAGGDQRLLDRVRGAHRRSGGCRWGEQHQAREGGREGREIPCAHRASMPELPASVRFVRRSACTRRQRPVSEL